MDASRVYWDVSMLPYAARAEPRVPDAEPDDDTPQARAFHEAFVAPFLGPRLPEVREFPRTVYSFIGQDGQESRAEFNAAENYWTWELKSYTQGPDEIWHRSAFICDVPIQDLPCFERSRDCVELALREPGMFDWSICRYTSGSRYDAWMFASVGVRERRRVVRYREVVGKHFDPATEFPFEVDARDIPHLRAGARAIAGKRERRLPPNGVRRAFARPGAIRSCLPSSSRYRSSACRLRHRPSTACSSPTSPCCQSPGALAGAP